MSKLIVNGGRPLSGTVAVSGAKNAILPLLAACLLTRDVCTLHNCPRLSDVDVSIDILRELGCHVTLRGHTVIVDSRPAICHIVPDALMREMRSSVVFLGAIAARFHKAVISNPGGCELGPRPIDIHLSSFEKMGMEIREREGALFCRADRLHGTDIVLPIPSVGATENILLAAVGTPGTTRIVNAAREPEIVDLCRFLSCCGAELSGAGSSTVTVQGTASLHGCTYTVMPDRIVASTYLCAVAAAGGKVTLKNACPEDMTAVLETLREMGCQITASGRNLTVESDRRLRAPEKVSTMYYPGFPTDAGTPLLAVMAVADGTSMLIENIFENRFRSVDEFVRLGARIKVSGRTAVICGVPSLHGAPVTATDLRAGAALVIAGLSAEGTTEISGLSYIDRGYEAIERSFAALGADIKRTDESG